MLYGADIAVPCAQKPSEKNVIFFIYQIISQYSWQIFATACKEQSVKISTSVWKFSLSQAKHLVGQSFFPCCLQSFLLVVWDVLCAFFAR